MASVEWSNSSGSDLLVEPLGEEGEFSYGVELSNDGSFVVSLPQP